MALYVASYRSRQAVVEDAAFLDWQGDPQQKFDDVNHWEGRFYAIHEGGRRFGVPTNVIRISRTDVDPEEDVPEFDLPTDGQSTSEKWTVEHEGRKLFVVQGELWRNEWIEPAEYSFRVRRDVRPPSVFYVTDAQGTRENRETLLAGGRWLWFKPEVMMALAHRRGGGLGWYTCDTGWVKCSPDDAVHFGVNRNGLINVYAKDIALLPDWQQQLWAGHNVGPDGGVSEELLAAQMQSQPADTQAPEAFLADGLDQLLSAGIQRYGVAMLRDHNERDAILARCHRFRACDRAGLFALSKDLARLSADLIDAAVIHDLLGLDSADRPGSLKSLERLVAQNVAPDVARILMAPLVGIYELRLADAHLPSSKLKGAFNLVGIDESAPLVQQGFQVLNACVSSIFEIAHVLDPSALAS